MFVRGFSKSDFLPDVATEHGQTVRHGILHGIVTDRVPVNIVGYQHGVLVASRHVLLLMLLGQSTERPTRCWRCRSTTGTTAWMQGWRFCTTRRAVGRRSRWSLMHLNQRITSFTKRIFTWKNMEFHHKPLTSSLDSPIATWVAFWNPVMHPIDLPTRLCAVSMLSTPS